VGEKAYLWLKAVHVLGAILFVGNLLVTAVWKTLADRTRDGRVIAYAQRMVGVTDVAFTGLGAVVVLLTGLLMIIPYGIEMWRVPWLMWGLGLFMVSGLLWVMVLVPVQIRQAKLARGFAEGGAIPDDYWRLARVWAIFGTVATLLPVVNVFLMVYKPL
jgi:uncharacterized membrane protein